MIVWVCLHRRLIFGNFEFVDDFFEVIFFNDVFLTDAALAEGGGFPFDIFEWTSVEIGDGTVVVALVEKGGVVFDFENAVVLGDVDLGEVLVSIVVHSH